MKPERLSKAIEAIEDFNHSSQLPFPEDKKQRMLSIYFPELVKELREAYNEIYQENEPKPNIHHSSFNIRGGLRKD
ncbi:hypothetical protein [Empedobacter falsenii]|uniref:Uncharacterized protein n=1 Tax=Empedobacter falsenii TaxID=343874 RepID=A0A376FXM3_9FLAO|nr:hypothetical protein [Empedobacter falsenii]STD53085.1 Uncharacterised protein [Empedobacter falsenii]